MKTEDLKKFCDSLILDGENLDRWAVASLLRLKKSTLMSQISQAPKTHATARGNSARPVQPQTAFIVDLLKETAETNPEKFNQLLTKAIKAGKAEKEK